MAAIAEVIGLGILLRWQDKASAQMRKAEKGLTGLSGSADEALKKTAKLEAGFAKLGKAGAIITGLGIAGAAGLFGVTKAASTFQDSLRDTMTMTGLTGKAFEEMEGQLGGLSLSLSTKFGMAAKEINKAFYQVLSSGAQAGTRQFEALTNSSLMMAKVVGMEPAMAVESLSDTLHSFEMDVSQAEKMADVFFKTSMLGATTVPQMALAMKEASKVAVEMGISLEEVASVLTGFASKGIKGAEAGTAFRMIMTKLAAPSGDAANALANLGVQVYDATTKKMRPVINILEDMKRGLAAVTHEEREAALKAITGEEAFAKLGGLLATDLSILRQWTGELKKGGAMQTAFAQKTGTAGFATAKLREGLRNVAITLGHALLPIVTPAVEWLSKWVGKIRDFLKAHPKLARIGAVFGAIASAVALVAGPILTVVGLIGSLGGLGAIVTSIGTGFASLAGVAGALGASLAAAFWPVTLAVVGIAALYFAVKHNFLGIGTIVKTVAGVIWSYIKGLWEGVKAALSPVIGSFREAFGALKEAFVPLWEGGKAIGEMLGLMSEGGGGMKSFMGIAKKLGKIVGYAIVLPLKVLLTINTYVIKAFAWLVKGAQKLGAWLGDKLGRNIDTVKRVLLYLTGPIGLVIMNFGKIKQAVRSVIDWVVSNWGTIKDVILAPVDFVIEGWTKVKEGLVGLFTSIKDTVAGVFESVKASISQSLDWIWNKITWVLTKIPDVFLPESLEQLKKEALAGGSPVGGQMVVPATAPAQQRATARPTVPREAGALPALAAAGMGGAIDQSITIQSGAVVIHATKVDEGIVLKIERELARILERRRERR